MANWREKINIHKVLGQMNDKHDLSRLEEECPEEVKLALAAELAKSEALKGFGAQVKRAKSIAGVNRVLERMFNAADRELVWVGIPS